MREFILTLNQALAIVKDSRGRDQPKVHFLACGCEPLHLATFLQAHLLERQLPGSGVQILTGLYGDLPGNLDEGSELARDRGRGCSRMERHRPTAARVA